MEGRCKKLQRGEWWEKVCASTARILVSLRSQGADIRFPIPGVHMANLTVMFFGI